MELQQESWGRNYWGEPQHHSTDTTFLLHISPRMSTCIPTVRGTTRYFCVFTFREVGLLCGQDKQAHSSLGCAEPTRAAPTAMPPFPASSITAYSTSGVCSRCLNSPGLVGVSLPRLCCKQRHEIPMDPVETAFCVIHIYLNLTRPLSAD